MPATRNRTGSREGHGRWPRSDARVIAASSIAIAAAACGRLWPVQTAPAAAPARTTYACVLSEVRRLGYKVTSDTAFAKRRDITASKGLPGSTRGPDVTEYSRADILVIRVGDASSDSRSTMRVEAESISTQETRRGPTEQSEPATRAVVADADSLIARCRNPSDSLTRTASTL